MCTNIELKEKLAAYMDTAKEIKRLEEIKRRLSGEILEEMDSRGTVELEAVKVIAERLTETATKEGKAYLKKVIPGSDIDKYISVSCSRYVNTRSLNKLIES